MTDYYIREQYCNKWKYVTSDEMGYDTSDVPQAFNALQVLSYLADNFDRDGDMIAERIVIVKVDE